MSIRKLWQALTRPSSRFALGSLVAAGAVITIAIGLTSAAAMEATSSDEFCLSCHELAQTVGIEYEGTLHHTNSLGVSVTCADCHVPKPIGAKIFRKLRAVNEIYHHLLGTIDTVEKFDEHRMRMALWTWREMNESDSRECRVCHDETRWDLEEQSEEARKYHQSSLRNGKTCIDCHKGIAHKLPKDVEEDEQLEGIDF